MPVPHDVSNGAAKLPWSLQISSGNLGFMKSVSFLLSLFPYIVFLCIGVFSVLEVFFPSLRDPDFGRWEVDEGSGSYIQIMGWKKIIAPPRVLAQGFMSDRAACGVALIIGVICILVGIFGIRHVGGLPHLLPDLFERF